MMHQNAQSNLELGEDVVPTVATPAFRGFEVFQHFSITSSYRQAVSSGS
jgi:hypothetical protein